MKQCPVCKENFEVTCRSFNGVDVCSPKCCSRLINREIAIHDGSIYNDAYFLRGKESGLSLYEDYRYLPELTTPMVCAIIRHCPIKYDDAVLDFGCARGYVVKVFREMGYRAYGIDVSEWAIRNADEAVRTFLNWSTNGPPLQPMEFDWILAKDVLEHVPQVADTIAQLMDAARTGVFAVVPLSSVDGESYIVADYEKDVTHIHRLTLATWVRYFARPGWAVEVAYRVKGVKDNYAQFPNGNGFVTCRRLDS